MRNLLYILHKNMALFLYNFIFDRFISEYCKRFLQSGTLAEAQKNHQLMLTALNDLRSYWLDVETIIIK